MADLFDDFSLPIECPECHQATQQKWSRLKNNPDLKCSKCGNTISIKADQLREAERSIKKQVDDMRKRFR